MEPWTHWREVLKSPTYVLAPMVDHSELPWRMLSREYGCQLVYTPMFHAANFAQKKYRAKQFSTCPEDRPLIVQFCANDPETLLEAARHVEPLCDGIDINLGCPQEIARRGRYGAFLQDNWALIERMVRTLRDNLDERVAVSCKIRRFEELDKTIEYAKMLERAGCSFIALHARTRDQRGCKNGLADWSYIQRVKESVSIPVIANGNIQSLRDAQECLRETRADAVMTAEGNLYNPALFRNLHPPAWEMAQRYLYYVEKYPVPAGMAKSHLFKLFHRCVAMAENAELRARLGQSISLEQLYAVIEEFRGKYEQAQPGGQSQALEINVLPVPPYLCQPRYRYDAPKEPAAEQLPGASCSQDESPVIQALPDRKRIKVD